MAVRDISDDTKRDLSQHDEDAGYPYSYPITYDGEVDTRNLKTFTGRGLK